MAQGASVPVCPMARYCSGMMESSLPSRFMTIAGFMMLALGVLIVLWPAVLPWLAAALAILVGVGMLMMAQTFHDMISRHREVGE